MTVQIEKSSLWLTQNRHLNFALLYPDDLTTGNYRPLSNSNIKVGLMIPFGECDSTWILVTDAGKLLCGWRPSVNLIEFCSCCRSAMKQRRMTAPECSGRSSLHFLLKLYTSLSCERRKSEKKVARMSTPQHIRI